MNGEITHPIDSLPVNENRLTARGQLRRQPHNTPIVYHATVLSASELSIFHINLF